MYFHYFYFRITPGSTLLYTHAHTECTSLESVLTILIALSVTRLLQEKPYNCSLSRCRWYVRVNGHSSDWMQSKQRAVFELQTEETSNVTCPLSEKGQALGITHVGARGAQNAPKSQTSPVIHSVTMVTMRFWVRNKNVFFRSAHSKSVCKGEGRMVRLV